MDMAYKIALICFGLAAALLVYMTVFDQSAMDQCLKVYSTDTCIMELR